MKDDLAPAIFFGVAMVAVTLGALILSEGPFLCSHPAATADVKGGEWCFEFWLNRYQTLIGGVFTLLAAGVAAVFVVGQTRVAQAQLAVMLGDIEPEFLVTEVTGSPLTSFRIFVFNQNRRALLVSSIEIMEPPGLQLFLEAGKDLQRLSSSEDARRHEIRLLLPGTRPSAEKVYSSEIIGHFAMDAVRAEKIGRRVTNITFRIQYELFASKNIPKIAYAHLKEAGISMTFSTSTDHTSVCLGNR